MKLLFDKLTRKGNENLTGEILQVFLCYWKKPSHEVYGKTLHSMIYLNSWFPFISEKNTLLWYTRTDAPSFEPTNVASIQELVMQ